MIDSNPATNIPSEPGEKACARYGALETDRFIFLQRAREAAEYTIPMLFPPEGHNSTTRYVTPYQSLGARGVNNLGAKLLLALLPPESCFFRLRLDAKLEAELENGPNAKPDDVDLMDNALSQMEQTVLDDINGRKARPSLSEAFKQLIVGGNTLVFITKDKGLRVFRMDQYVVQRDPDGNALEIVVKEMVAPNALPASIKEQVLEELRKEQEGKSDADKKKHGDLKTVEVFTWIRREEKQWSVCQECKNICIPGSEGTYPLEKCPWLPLRWTKIDGENYGRGLCEEYIGDLASLESLSKMLVQAAVVAGKVIIMVKPNGSTRPENLANKPNGAVVEGDPEDVHAFQLEKNTDFTFVSNLSQAIEQRLSFAFLLNSSVQRQGERVTAEEIRYMASELEDALGGVYSLLSDELQRPLAELVIAQMESTGRLPKLPNGSVKISVVTGLDALGRSHELSRLMQFVQGASQALSPQVVAQYVNPGDCLTRMAAALGIRTKGLCKTDEEVQAAQQQAQQQAQQAALAQKAAGPAINAASQVAQAQQQQQQGQQGPQQAPPQAAPQGQ